MLRPFSCAPSAPRWSRLLSLFMAAASLASGCVSLVHSSLPALTPTATPGASHDWESLAPGVERRLFYPKPNNPLVQLLALRLDPALYEFRAHYRPGSPLSVTHWAQALPGAAAFVNANFFDPQRHAVGLVVTDGLAFGQPFVDRGGTFHVTNGQPRLRSNLVEPLTGEPLEQAVQAFPMLLVDGAPAYTNTHDTDVSRRTVVAQDSMGRVVFLVTPLAGITLHELSAFLAAADLNLVTALNLDGGGSTMMYIGAGDAPVSYRSFDSVPVVLAAYPRPGTPAQPGQD